MTVSVWSAAKVLRWWWLLTLLTRECLSARILGISPMPSVSHQMPFHVITRALAERGHDVTIITTDLMKDPPSNLTQIDLSFSYEAQRASVNFVEASQKKVDNILTILVPVTEKLCDLQMQSPQMQQFLNSGQKFDLVIMEVFLLLCYFGVVNMVGSPPIVGFFTTGMYPSLSDYMGNPWNSAFMPELASTYTNRMTFWERMGNVYEVTVLRNIIENHAIPAQERVMRKYFGTQVPTVSEMRHNISLLLVTNHFSTGYPVPLVPNIKELTGLHIQKTRKPLPKDVQEFLDNAQHGVIYFSLGSNVRSENLPEDKRLALLEAFSALPQRVLWKFEADSLPGQPDNVMVAKWLPQQDVLAHPNIRLFVTQGGLQSFNEAAYFGVPILGIPFFGDQKYNVAKIVAAGIGEKLQFEEVTKESVLRAVRRILENESYRENMRRFSAVYREHQAESLDKAVWWVEYVIRHNGARHLRSAAMELRWWQYYLLDVFLFLLAAVTLLLVVLYKGSMWIARSLWFRQKAKKS